MKSCLKSHPNDRWNGALQVWPSKKTSSAQMRARANPVFDGHLSGAYMDFRQLDATHNRDGDHSIRSDWHDLGHYIWDIPMSMFTVIGLLGMTGIIINDSIVLITTIDEYAEDRGIIPSLIDATVDRFRPVLLTTLTTVLGLAPLLYERSTQAQFLKPTVVTLVYGLGFGMVLVLIVVPSLIAIQQDVMRYRVSLKRALSSRNSGVRMAFIAAVGAIVAWFAATMGVYIVTGDFISFIGAASTRPHQLGWHS